MYSWSINQLTVSSSYTDNLSVNSTYKNLNFKLFQFLRNSALRSYIFSKKFSIWIKLKLKFLLKHESKASTMTCDFIIMQINISFTKVIFYNNFL